MKSDIGSKADVEKLVNEQYRLLLEDEHTGPVFADLDLEHHMPKIYRFWCFILDVEAAKNIYIGSAFEPHVKLDLDHDHFVRWVRYFNIALDTFFEGEVTEKAREKVRQFDIMFEHKLNILPNE
jgi:hemoglobin